MQQPWLRLAQLDIYNILFRTTDMALLVQAQLPCLSYLTLLNTGLCTDTLQLLVTRNWPHLEHLDLSHNRINDTAMSHLAKGSWPKLEEVHLEDNQVTPLGIACLTEASWPALSKMCADRKAVCVATIESVDAATRMQVLKREYRLWVGTRLKSRAIQENEWSYVHVVLIHV